MFRNVSGGLIDQNPHLLLLRHCCARCCCDVVVMLRCCCDVAAALCPGWRLSGDWSPTSGGRTAAVWTRAANDPSVFTIMVEKVFTGASSWLKALTSAFTFKTLLCDCENRWIVCSSSLDTVAAQAYLIPQSPHSLHCTTLHNTTALVR